MTARFPRGFFVKTPAPQHIEILAGTGADFAVVDAEHAPFDRADLNLMILAGRAAGMPVLVRVLDRTSGSILTSLDLGATGIVVPHVDSLEIAREVVGYARYRGGLRGYSSAPRHAGYGTMRMADVLTEADRALVIVQLEHPSAVAEAGQILNLDGIDGVLIGRADLALSMGEESTAVPSVEEAVREIFAQTASSKKIKGVVVSSSAEAARYASHGANWFIMGNDQGLLRSAAAHVLAEPIDVEVLLDAR
ncbi:MAG TPA: aldolase/citrate lyase family protein [Sphingobium sp.]|nr:aldolase/citrate lyase family protein [Sphingobium sp.]